MFAILVSPGESPFGSPEPLPSLIIGIASSLSNSPVSYRASLIQRNGPQPAFIGVTATGSAEGRFNPGVSEKLLVAEGIESIGIPIILRLAKRGRTRSSNAEFVLSAFSDREPGWCRQDS